MKRIAFPLLAAAVCLLSLCACAKTESSAASDFPEDVDFVVVDHLPEDDGASQDGGADVLVSAFFYDAGEPMRAVPVFLSVGGTAILAELTDAYGRLACGELPAGEDVLFCVSPSPDVTLRAGVIFVSSSKPGAVSVPDGVTAVVPDGTLGDCRTADLLFLAGNGGAASAARQIEPGPLLTGPGDVLHLS